MTLRSVLRRQVALVRHFMAHRSAEVLVLQGAPLLGLIYGGAAPRTAGLLRPTALIAGSLFLTAHIFVFNDWSDHDRDAQDPHRTSRTFCRKGVSKFQTACAATLLLVLANVALAFAGRPAVLLGALIALLGLLYSGSSRFGKSRPFAASANHLLGGSLHFLIGYTLCHAADAAGITLSLFFGLVFAGGHLNQEVRDFDGDRLNGIRTCAVAFGRRRAFAGSLMCFALAYALASALAMFGVLPAWFLWCPVLLLIHLAVAWHFLRMGLSYETARRMQRCYRALFALIGLMMYFGFAAR